MQWETIAHSFSFSPSFCPDMTRILLKTTYNRKPSIRTEKEDPYSVALPQTTWSGQSVISILLHGPLMFTAKAKIYRVLYKQSSSIAFHETSSYWSAPKNS